MVLLLSEKYKNIFNYFLINSIHPFGVHGKNPDISPIATLPSLIVFNLER